MSSDEQENCSLRVETGYIYRNGKNSTDRGESGVALTVKNSFLSRSGNHKPINDRLITLMHSLIESI